MSSYPAAREGEKDGSERHFDSNGGWKWLIIVSFNRKTYCFLSDGYTFNIFNNLQAITGRNEAKKQGGCFGIEKTGVCWEEATKNAKSGLFALRGLEIWREWFSLTN
ncbi:MAG: hypothetical protein K1Y36_22355 [Blastocatellia bacterium]|nr:hypothetical protein [Blastocatellia bacterium]